jgi:hypothetical protein
MVYTIKITEDSHLSREYLTKNSKFNIAAFR